MPTKTKSSQITGNEKKEFSAIIFGESYTDYFLCKQKPTIEKNGDPIHSRAYLAFPHVKSYTREGGIDLIKSLLDEVKIEDFEIKYDTYNNQVKLCTYSTVKEYPTIPEYLIENCRKYCSSIPENKCRLEEFIGIDESQLIRNNVDNDTPPIQVECKPYKYIIINDRGDGFFKSLEKNQYKVLFERKGDSKQKENLLQPEIIFLSTNPSYFFSRQIIEKYYSRIKSKDKQKLIIITNISELRDTGGFISKGLSWEKTIQDTIWQIENNSKINHLLLCDILIIRIEYEGAIVIFPSVDGSTSYHVIFAPNLLEGDYSKKRLGSIRHRSAFFLSFFYYFFMKKYLKSDKNGSQIFGIESKSITKEAVIDAIKHSLKALQEILDDGYHKEGSKMSLPNILMIEEKSEDNYKRSFSELEISPDIISPQNVLKWSILKAKKGGDTFNDIAKKLLVLGPENYSKDSIDQVLPFPIYQVGKLISIDKSEIESYQSIRNIIIEYINNKNHKKPLSFVVFGPPGSGKSFGLKQIINGLPNVASKDFDNLTCNLSQYNSYTELTNIFHRIRDVGLSGEIPVAFFDEFDSNYDSTPLGWIRYFLAPMQDGMFFSHEHYHPFGKVIFIFAGGKNQSYEEFVKSKDYYEQKGPDFVSRLRGHINIIGHNFSKVTNLDDKSNETKYQIQILDNDHQTVSNTINVSQISNLIESKNDNSIYNIDDDKVVYIRRALLLRSILEEKAPHLFNKDKKLLIDRNVIRAFFKVSSYKHGARSIRAIVEMSTLSGYLSFEAACLPPRQILLQHTDADDFLNLLRRNYKLNEISYKLFFEDLNYSNDLQIKLSKIEKSEKCDHHLLNIIKNELDKKTEKNTVVSKVVKNYLTNAISKEIEIILHSYGYGFKKVSSFDENSFIEFEGSSQNLNNQKTDDYISNVVIRDILKGNVKELVDKLINYDIIIYPL